ncbi:UDP-N-acetylmuramoyl-L-alanyl-D-glutamate--2,6-diaminopimelate ligase [Thermosulfuriphilus sp.]
MRDHSRPTRLKKLQDLGLEVPGARVLGPEVMITAITDDSRKVAPGSLFVAIVGHRADGHAFISQAKARGAVAFAVERPEEVPTDSAALVVPNTREAAGFLAAAFYDHPGHDLLSVAVTGTNGKTTVTHLLEKVLDDAGLNPGLIGTIEYRGGGERVTAVETTPGPIRLQEILATFRQRGVRSVVLEASSHGLVQGRLNGLRVRAAIFTNLSRDHLDYHPNLEAYYQAKKRLFTDYLDGPAIINLDNPYGQRLARELGGEVITFGLKRGKIRGRLLQVDLSGIRLEIKGPFGVLNFKSPLVGAFQAENLLAAFSCAYSLGLEPEQIILALSEASGAPGRLETMESPLGFTAVVDYAHSPEALERALKTLREMTVGRLILVFGCGGDRDKGKRPLMAEVASRLADLIIITSDNPRSEDPEKIIAEIKKGLHPDTAHRICVSRKEAIYMAVNEASSGDCLLIAGKGHETYQEISGRRYPFDDRKVLEAALAFRALGEKVMEEVAAG